MKLVSFIANRVYNQFNFNIDFYPDISILYGINGCGKTTVLKLINYIIEGRFSELKEIAFDIIILNYKYKEENYSLRIKNGDKFEIESNHQEIKNAIFKINFNKSPELEPPIEVESLKKIEIREKKITNMQRTFKTIFNAIFLSIERKVEKTSFSYYNDPYFLSFLEEYVGRDPNSLSSEELKEHYRIFLRRYEFEYQHRGRKKRVIQISNPIQEVNNLIRRNYNEYQKFCSRLDQEYQEDSYKKMVSLKKLEEIKSKILEFDKDYIKIAKDRIFNQITYFKEKFEIPAEEDFKRLIENFNDEKNKVENGDEPTGSFLLNFIQFLKLDELAIILEDNNSKKEKMKEPFKILILNLNDFFSVTKKEAIFEDDSIRFRLKNGETIGSNDLSSGEKQILIFFSHLIFNEQDKTEPIILYDEPDLSLHLDWQEKFIDSIFRTNNTIQIILATHSPAIGGGNYKTREISLESSIT